MIEMNPVDLVQLQISLEYQLDAGGLLVPFDNSSEQAYYVVYQHSQGFTPYFSSELPADVRVQLLDLGLPKAFTHPDEVKQLFSENNLPCRGGDDIYWSGYFSHPPGPNETQEVCHHGEAWSVLHEGLEVCRAISVRQNEHCAEVYVETLPAYRRRGYGRRVVAAWALEVMKTDRVAFYSFRLRNTASAAVASSLGAQWYANVVAYEPG
jgi:GNAT superfamily N-acetyltransferase